MGEKTMNSLFCFAITCPAKKQKIDWRRAAKIRVRPVEKAEYAQTIAALCGAEDAREAAYTGAGFEDEMLVMANFPAGMMNTFLGLFRRMGHRARWRSRQCLRRPTRHGTAKSCTRSSRRTSRHDERRREETSRIKAKEASVYPQRERQALLSMDNECIEKCITSHSVRKS